MQPPPLVLVESLLVVYGKPGSFSEFVGPLLMEIRVSLGEFVFVFRPPLFHVTIDPTTFCHSRRGVEVPHTTRNPLHEKVLDVLPVRNEKLLLYRSYGWDVTETQIFARILLFSD